MNRETLIIDDDKIICILHEKMCKLHGLPNPKSFTSPDKALDYLLSKNSIGHSFTILLDINMPLINGWQFLELLEQETLLADIYLVLLTSSVDKRDMEMADKHPLVDAFLSKPLDTSKMNGLKEDKRLRERLDNIA